MLDLDRLPSRAALVALALIGAGAAAQDESMDGSIVAPVSRHAVVDETGAGASRPVVHVLSDGRVLAGEEVLFDPAEPDEVERLRAWLGAAAALMEKEEVEIGGETRELAGGELRLAADRGAPFSSVQLVLVQCAHKDVVIWRHQLVVERAGAEEEEEASGYLRFRLPIDLSAAEPVEMIEVIVRILEQGSRIARATGEPWTSPDDGPFEFGPDRRLRYDVGPYQTKTLSELPKRLTGIRKYLPDVPAVIVPNAGVLVGDVVPVIDAILDAGIEEYAFVEPWE